MAPTNGPERDSDVALMLLKVAFELTTRVPVIFAGPLTFRVVTLRLLMVVGPVTVRVVTES